MKVYVVIFGEEYSHSDVVGVFSEVGNAVALRDSYVEKYKLTNNYYSFIGSTNTDSWGNGLYFVHIEEHEVQ